MAAIIDRQDCQSGQNVKSEIKEKVLVNNKNCTGTNKQLTSGNILNQRDSGG